MIEFIRGRLMLKSALGDSRVIVDVSGVGFGINVSGKTVEKLGGIGETIEILTYLHVREDALDLYGFINGAEKTLFLKLLDVSGIGPKLALRILTAVSPNQLANYILQGDVQGLTALKGVGKKTAEVLIATLRTSVSKLHLETEPGGIPSTAAIPVGPFRDAVLALMTLGVKEPQAQEAVQKAGLKLEKNAEVGRIIAQALQEI